MQVIHVDKIEHLMGNGYTNPMLASLSRGNEKFYAVIKTKDNKEGILTLVNELICYKMAYALNILMPESGIAYIDENTEVPEGLIETGDLGCCFYSKFLEKTAILNESIIDLTKNKDAYEDIILFDHMVYNKDRNRGNLLISTGKGDKLLYTIDHTHVFKNEAIWDRYCFKQGIEGNDYLDRDILDSNEFLYSLFFRNKNITKQNLLSTAEKYPIVITKEVLTNIIDNIPSDWDVPVRDLEALKEYLLYRVGHINDICEMITEYRNGGKDYV